MNEAGKIKELIAKYAEGKASEQEIAWLESVYLNWNEADQPLYPEDFLADMDQLMWTNISQRVKIDAVKVVPIWRRWSTVAASVALCLAIGIGFYFSKSVDHKVVHTATNKVEILPGGNKAMLILANGKSMNLDNSNTGVLATQGMASIQKTADGQLKYDAAQGAGQSGSAINEIRTPRGGQYQVTLSDGTQVWLNAESSIKFPAVFSGAKRIVELVGEAYFQVAKNREMPFILKTKGQEVTVLGTHFNVSAYNDDEYTQTTLIEGAVKLNGNGAEALLKPGQQATLLKDESKFVLKSVNTEDFIGWKNGVFSFENTDVKTIMKEISRWYDMDIEYRGAVSQHIFGGTVSRFKNLSELLKTMELTETIHFKIEGRRIIVMP